MTLPKSRATRRKNRTTGRGPSGKPPIVPKHDQAYLKDLNGVAQELAAKNNHELHDMNAHVFGVDPDDHDSPELGRSLAEEHVQPDTLVECGPDGHRRQAWNVMLGEQEYAQPCPTCDKTPDFVETRSGMPELGFRCNGVFEAITADIRMHHELCLMGKTAPQFEFHTEIEHLEWPEKGSTNLTRQPYPGDDAITVQWLIDEIEARGNMTPNTPVTNPENRALFTDDFLRQYVKFEREDWTVVKMVDFSYKLPSAIPEDPPMADRRPNSARRLRLGISPRNTELIPAQTAPRTA